MNTTQAQLLRSLGSGVRPVDLGEPRPDGDDRFGSMLRGALDGHARSEVGVTLAPSLSGVFDFEQRDSIARAVDIAAAAGSERALIMHDRQALRVDVRNRVVSDVPELEAGGIVSGIDAFVLAQTPVDDEENDELPPMPGVVVHPARVVRNASLVRMLAQSGVVLDHDS